MSSTIQADIEARLAETEPDVEVLLAEIVGGRLVRLFIDHPEGVTLDLCERVTHRLPDVNEKYALEVSSPGEDRPLTKPEHFRRFTGHRVRVRTREAIEGQRSFTGTLTAANDTRVRISAGAGEVEIPLAGIRRSNLVPDHTAPMEGVR